MLKYLQSTSPYLYNAALLYSAFSLSLGVIGLISPSHALRIFGFANVSSPESRKLGTNLMLFQASRDVFMGAVTLAAWWEGDRKMLGWMYLSTAGVAACDGVMSERQIGKDGWKHAMYSPILVGMGLGMLGVFD